MSAIEECRSFAARHGLAVSEKLTRLGEPIVAIAAVRSIVDSAVAAFLAEDIEAQPTIGMLHKMLSDILDQCEDMLVALSSCSPPTAEIIARATLERGVNLRYIIGQDRERRLLEYIGEYVSTSESMVSGLSKTFAEASPEERPYFEAALAQRRWALDFCRGVLPGLAAELGAQPQTKWPNAWARFKDVGLKVDYWTIYAALSAQVHGGPEDLFHELVARSLPRPEQLAQQLAENAEFSASMVGGTLKACLDVALEFCRRFKLSQAAFSTRTVIAEFKASSFAQVPAVQLAAIMAMQATTKTGQQ